MSLINDALNRARAEATRTEAEERGEPQIPVASSDRSFRISRVTWAAAGVVLLALLLWLGRRDGAQPTDLAKAARPSAGPESQQIAAATLSDAETPATTLAEESRPDTGEELSEKTSSREALSSGHSSREDPASASSSATATVSLPADRSEAVAKPPAAAPPASPPHPEERPPAQPIPEAVVERAPPANPALPSPAVVWPQDGDSEETWYYVGAVSLPGGGSIELGGIAWSESAPSAMLNGSLLGVGDDILGLTVSEIGPRTVVLEGHGQRIALQLGSERP